VSSPTAGVAWRPYGEHGVLIEFESADATLVAYRTCRLGPFEECVPGARTIYMESERHSPSELARIVEELLEKPSDLGADEIVRTHTIPVRYDGADLSGVAELTGLSMEEVIARHCGVTYTVAFLGFSRSFAYLAGIDPSIIVPRLTTPRTVVPAGSVGIGAGYTGVYPMASPGGWRLLGRTDAVMFDAANDPPAILSPGDRVRFERTTP
jgi:5-oxoprolinase (ATP-hydrolysing) subunit B